MHWALATGVSIGSYMVFGVLLSAMRAAKHKTRYRDSFLAAAKGRPSWVPKEAFVIDAHFHTTHSSDGSMTPSQAVAWCIANGYDGMAITDHNSMDGVAEAQTAARKLSPNFVVIPGFEWTNMRFHSNVLGAPKCPVAKSPLQWPSDVDVAVMTAWAHKYGGIAQYNHPADPGCLGLTREEVLSGGFDAVETVSGIYNVSGSAHPYSRFCSEHNLAETCGTDTHLPGDRARVYMEILGLGAEDKTPSGVLKAIKAGKVSTHTRPEAEETTYGGIDLGRIGVPKILLRMEDAFTLPVRKIPKLVLSRAKF
jgi:predicted metal-dependent phosphoesterase TrpH